MGTWLVLVGTRLLGWYLVGTRLVLGGYLVGTRSVHGRRSPLLTQTARTTTAQSCLGNQVTHRASKITRVSGGIPIQHISSLGVAVYLMTESKTEYVYICSYMVLRCCEWEMPFSALGICFISSRKQTQSYDFANLKIVYPTEWTEATTR